MVHLYVSDDDYQSFPFRMVRMKLLCCSMVNKYEKLSNHPHFQICYLCANIISDIDNFWADMGKVFDHLLSKAGIDLDQGFSLCRPVPGYGQDHGRNFQSVNYGINYYRDFGTFLGNSKIIACQPLFSHTQSRLATDHKYYRVRLCPIVRRAWANIGLTPSAQQSMPFRYHYFTSFAMI